MKDSMSAIESDERERPLGIDKVQPCAGEDNHRKKRKKRSAHKREIYLSKHYRAYSPVTSVFVKERTYVNYNQR